LLENDRQRLEPKTEPAADSARAEKDECGGDRNEAAEADLKKLVRRARGKTRKRDVILFLQIRRVVQDNAETDRKAEKDLSRCREPGIEVGQLGKIRIP
jgi:hypothetical protein